MTNEYIIRNMSAEDLARFLVRPDKISYTGFTWDGWDEYPETIYEDVWRCSDNTYFEDEDVAVEYELNWLKQKSKGIVLIR